MLNLRLLVLVLILVVSGAVGLGVALALAPDEGPGDRVTRVRNGVTETGEVETATVGGVVRHVIRWRTKEGENLTETVRGPVRLQRVEGGTVLVPGPAAVRTTTLPGETKTTTLPGQTLVETVTQTDTVTETVRDTVTDVVTVTERLPADTVTVVVTETVGSGP